jgi:hypothetical protein
MHWKYEADKNLVNRTAFNWIILRPGGLTNNPGTGTASVGRTHLGKTISVCTLYSRLLCLYIYQSDLNFSETMSQKLLHFSSTERMQLVWQSILLEATPPSRTVWMPSSRKAKLTSWVDYTNKNGISNTCKYYSNRYFLRERLELKICSLKKDSRP